MMAKKKDTHLEMMNMSAIALVALVAIVGVTGMVLFAKGGTGAPTMTDENVVGNQVGNAFHGAIFAKERTCKDVPESERSDCETCVEVVGCYNEALKKCQSCSASGILATS
jgi:hypothetical protein